MSRVALRYARALFAVAQEEQAIEDVIKHLGLLKDQINACDDLCDFFSNPLVTRSESQKFLKHLCEKCSFHPLIEKFLLLLSYNRRLRFFSDIVTNMVLLHEQKQNILKGLLISARPLKGAQIKELSKVLSDKLKKDVLLEATTNEDLLGGMIIHLGSYRLDSSLRTKLHSFQTLVKG